MNLHHELLSSNFSKLDHFNPPPSPDLYSSPTTPHQGTTDIPSESDDGKWRKSIQMQWYPTTAEEMRAFVGLNVIMGIDQKPELCNYWSTDEFLGNVGIQHVFTPDHYESLCRYL